MDGPSLTVTAKREGFRRAGRAWSTTPQTVPVEEFTEEQIDTLREDPGLVVVVQMLGADGGQHKAVLTPETAVGADTDGPSLTVTAKREGFRRAGRAWSTTPQTVPIAELTEEQLDALRADPNLVVVEHGTDLPREGEDGDDNPRREPSSGAGAADGKPATEGVDPSPPPAGGGGEPPPDTPPVRTTAQAKRALNTGAPASKHDVIVKAIGRLDPNDKTLWGRDGKPKVAGIEKVAGIDVTAAMRDAAWDAIGRGDVRDG